MTSQTCANCGHKRYEHFYPATQIRMNDDERVYSDCSKDCPCKKFVAQKPKEFLSGINYPAPQNQSQEKVNDKDDSRASQVPDALRGCGTIEKIGFRTYCLWYSNTDGIHFKGEFNVKQAYRLMQILKQGKNEEKK